VTPPEGAAVLGEPEIITFGCRLNAYESEVMRGLAAGADDTVIINSCAVTAEAERQARQTIRKLRRDRPNARIVVTGCAAQINPGQFARMAEVDLVLGNEDKLKAESFGSHVTERVIVNDIMVARETAGHLIEGFDGRARAFVQVQQGCDHRCTFCIIPFGRGNSRSVPVGEIVAQVRLLVERGFNEIVLTGVDVTSYGADLPGKPSLGGMVRRLLRLVPELKRLRLSSLDPVEIDDELWRAFAEEERLMPHLHLSIQAGSDLILKRMKRRHLRADVYAACDKARSLRRDIVFGADFIAGFPTESDQDFADTLALADECKLTYLHVFPYSSRPGTPAARMPQLGGVIVKQRAAELRALSDRLLGEFLDAQIGKPARILIEQPGFGRTEQFAPISIGTGEPGDLLSVLATGRTSDGLVGIPQ
jgi:threonylcarbamoyladenosine tRNA methylthiotransferase MtaB